MSLKPPPLRTVEGRRESDLDQVAWLWLGRLQGQPAPALREAFEAWLYAAPEHVDAYTRAEDLWRMTQPGASRLAVEESDQLDALLARMDAPPRRRAGRWGAVLAMAASLLLVVWAGGWHPLDRLDDLGADHVTAAGEVRDVTLADGSVLTLDADSAVAIHYGAQVREVELRRGAAFFSVTPGQVPFVVTANGGEARVLGTRFEVRLRPAGARVTVEQGRVGVRAHPGDVQQVLGAGQQVHFADSRTGTVEAVDAPAQLSWREGRLTFYRAPLGEVLVELDRYYPGRIVLLDRDLASQRISGSFPSNDPAAVLASLQAVVGFKQDELLGRVMILR
ncbi:FecR family protein [Pseudomonas sp. BN415]|uniref:FecR family protein n=1 Tax=Pseudomonas sp. BN415 TaxID=2567889 RepID=UPI0024546E0F|nr:FecR family protein [Pseudomonas sp. BN415]MDH4580419.1 FecR family protein [Pseudomonas sp. BN415]